MENIFFNPVFLNLAQTLIALFIFLAVIGFILYFLFFIFSKLLFKKSKQRKEITLRLAFLWSLTILFFLFNIYIFIFFYKVGIDNLNFTSALFYLGILPQLFIYLALIIFFFIKRHSLKILINNNSLN